MLKRTAHTSFGFLETILRKPSLINNHKLNKQQESYFSNAYRFTCYISIFQVWWWHIFFATKHTLPSNITRLDQARISPKAWNWSCCFDHFRSLNDNNRWPNCKFWSSYCRRLIWFPRWLSWFTLYLQSRFPGWSV